jgi:leucyl-tRNA synthetase
MCSTRWATTFGLPAEQYAIKTGQHPASPPPPTSTPSAASSSRSASPTTGTAKSPPPIPGYVRWTQWIFLQIYNSYFCETYPDKAPAGQPNSKPKAGPATDRRRAPRLRRRHPVWWSPDLGTVLANEEVEEWKAKGHTVERRPLRQWMLRITKYAQRLIDELDTLDWPDGIKLLQKNWIGRSEGAEVNFKFRATIEITVFTTRPDTLFGATYMVLAPEHPLVAGNHHAGAEGNRRGLSESLRQQIRLDRGDLNKDKSGVFTGAHAINPVNGENPRVDRRLRHDGLRHRRDHGRARA